MVVVGYPISILTGGAKVDPKLLSPLFRPAVRSYKLANLGKSHTEMTLVASPEEIEKLKEKSFD